MSRITKHERCASVLRPFDLVHHTDRILLERLDQSLRANATGLCIACENSISIGRLAFRANRPFGRLRRPFLFRGLKSQRRRSLRRHAIARRIPPLSANDISRAVNGHPRSVGGCPIRSLEWRMRANYENCLVGAEHSQRQPSHSRWRLFSIDAESWQIIEQFDKLIQTISQNGIAQSAGRSCRFRSGSVCN